MGFFSRNPEAVEVGPAADVPFETLRRKPRGAARARAPLDGNRESPPPLDPAETAKTRARRRLIGAVALAAAAVVFVPMLFDRTPASIDDIALQIPDRDTPFEGRRGVPDATRGPLKGASNLPIPATSPTPPPVVQPSVATAPATTATTTPPTTATTTPPTTATTTSPRVESPTETPAANTPPEKAPPKANVIAPADKAPDKPVERPAEKSANAPADDPKAIAALEGKTGDAAKGAGSYAVQIAAFSVADKARVLRDRLVANGLKSYTEPVSTTQGVRTRVRLGPFASREAADRAKDKLKTMKLDGTVVPL
jgi:DedD protein